MALSSRFALDTTAIVGGGFVAVAAMSFATVTAGWIGFGVFTLFVVLATAAVAMTRRTQQKLSHGALAAVGLWSLIAALVFTGSAQLWLVFAGGLALAAVALGDLIAHEATTERVVHQLEVRETGGAHLARSENQNQAA
jgi:hypothetical protein